MNLKPMPADKTVRLHQYHSIMFGPHYALVRRVDGRTEALGFATKAEAVEWAEEYGWTMEGTP